MAVYADDGEGVGGAALDPKAGARGGRVAALPANAAPAEARDRGAVRRKARSTGPGRQRHPAEAGA